MPGEPLKVGDRIVVTRGYEIRGEQGVVKVNRDGTSVVVVLDCEAPMRRRMEIDHLMPADA